MAVGCSRVGSGEVVVMHPQRQLAHVGIRVAVDEGIGPPPQQGLDEMLILAIGAVRVRGRAGQMPRRRNSLAQRHDL